MRVALLIDSLGSGGAQRQMVELAMGLKRRSHEVTLCYYYPSSFYLPFLQEAGVEYIELKPDGMFDKIKQVRSWLKNYKPDILQSFLEGPNAVAALSLLFRNKIKFVASERNTYTSGYHKTLKASARRLLYRRADWIVANSHAGKDVLANLSPNLSKKISVIWNCVNTERFRPRNHGVTEHLTNRMHFVCVASVQPSKNPYGVIKALSILRDTCKVPFEFSWIGNVYNDIKMSVETYNGALKLATEYHLEDIFHFKGESDNVAGELQNADAFLLCSFYEGVPNALCEAMSSGLPAIVSKVSDLPLLVKDGANGYLCDPDSPQSIAGALKAMLELDPDRRREMGMLSREFALQMFGTTRYIDEYERLYFQLLNAKVSKDPNASSGNNQGNGG
jgi:glycosyltransferase involved in cell wall biosynthesis